MMNMKCAARRFLFLLATSLLGGCLQPTDGGGSCITLAGRWQHVATETGATGSSFNGVLILSQGSSAAFRGSLDGTSVSLITGESKAVAGTVSGSASAPETIDFDVALETGPRRHVGQLAVDTLSGTWLKLSGQGGSTSGTFSAVWIRQ